MGVSPNMDIEARDLVQEGKRNGRSGNIRRKGRHQVRRDPTPCFYSSSDADLRWTRERFQTDFQNPN
jgi:hypothetical protein